MFLTSGGVGYQVFLPLSLLSGLKISETRDLIVHSHFRQEGLELYGFEDQEQKAFFERLISLNGVGPKLALEALNMPLSQLRGAIENEDVSVLTSIKGLGKKTAERMILELKGKLPDSFGESSAGPANDDVVLALINLGYKRKHIEDVFKTLPKQDFSEEELIRYFLQNA